MGAGKTITEHVNQKALTKINDSEPSQGKARRSKQMRMWMRMEMWMFPLVFFSLIRIFRYFYLSVVRTYANKSWDLSGSSRTSINVLSLYPSVLPSRTMLPAALRNISTSGIWKMRMCWSEIHKGPVLFSQLSCPLKLKTAQQSSHFTQSQEKLNIMFLMCTKVNFELVIATIR